MKDAAGWLSGLRASDGGGGWSFEALQREGEAGWQVDVLGAGVVGCWNVCGKVEKLL